MADLLSNKERLILNFHKLEGDFFHRLVHDLGQDPTTMRWVIAFWLWLESVGHHDFVRRAYAMPGPVVLRFVEEAVACLRCLAGVEQDTAIGGNDRVTRLPCTNAFLAQPIDGVGFFADRRDKVLKGVTYLYETVCLVVCVRESSTPLKISSPSCSSPPPVMMLSSSSNRAAHQLMMSVSGHASPLMMSVPGHATPLMMNWPGYFASPEPSSMLNPMASPWAPIQVQNTLPEGYRSVVPEDYRSLFITFSKGYPVSRDDIRVFFNSTFGPCVESVMLEKVQPGQMPLYGRIVLRSAAMVPVVLEGQQTAKFLINGRHLWARFYIPS